LNNVNPNGENFVAKNLNHAILLFILEKMSDLTVKTNIRCYFN
jgi:hypothetical protein